MVLLLIMELIRRHFDIIDSTNTWAKHNAHLLPRDKMTLVTAEGQTAGRGRFRRNWESPPGQNIYASFCFFIDKQRKDLGYIPQILALSAIHILEKLNFKVELKWPNDLLIGKKKVAGILTETTPISDQLCMIIGIGLNVNMTDDYLQRIDKPATSLLVERGHPFDIEDLLHQLRNRFIEGLKLFLEEGFSPFFDAYRSYICFGEPIRFHDNVTLWEGTLHSINSDGLLILKLPNGSLKTFITGEIVLEKHTKADGIIQNSNAC